MLQLLLVDAEKHRQRQVAMDEARRRLQERHDADAARFAEQQKLVGTIRYSLLTPQSQYHLTP